MRWGFARGCAIVALSGLACRNSPTATSDDAGADTHTSGEISGTTASSPDDGDATTAVAESTAAEGGTADGSGDDTGAVAPPPYPIVLVHGFFGFEGFAGVDFVGYFWEVRDRLAEAGETAVYTPAIDPFNDSTVRGEQLRAIVEQIVEETGAGKVNLVGHSQGGLDARVVAHLRPDLVASVTTFATPHGGTPIADVALGLAEEPNAAAIIDTLVALAGAPLWAEVDGDTSLAASMMQLSSAGMAEFNATYPNAPGVAYYSLTGRSGLAAGGPYCESDVAPPFVTSVVDERDPIEPLLSGPYALLADGLASPRVNDGLVRASDAHWGTFLGCVPADHFDEIGHLFGDLPGITNAWRHDAFYVELVAWLRAQGY